MELNYKDSLSAALANNRSEHIGMDVWNDFVIPFFYKKIDFDSSFPMRIEGGRGSGKTMLLRYLSYHSRFSDNRKNIPPHELNAIGLYIRADTQFLRQLQKRGIEEHVWLSVFSHYINIILLTEITSALLKISNADFYECKRYNFSHISSEILSIYGSQFAGKICDLEKTFQDERRKCELAVANPKLIDNLLFLPDSCLSDFVKEVSKKSECPNLKFKIYVDEYENLLKYQQLIINTRMKHSEPPLIFNIAVKLNGAPHAETVGEESITFKHDYTIENLDNLLSENSFDCFAAEILFLRLSKSDEQYKKIFSGIQLNSVHDLEKRADEKYQERVLREARLLLPGKSHEDLADDIFNTPKLISKLKSEIEIGLKQKGSKLNPDAFLSEKNKKASIVASSLLFRKKTEPEEILEQLNLLENGNANKFSGTTSWTQNFFIGSYLRLIRSFKTDSNFYAGFDVYVLLSSGNMRHFLELCRTAFSNFTQEFQDHRVIDCRAQHISAMQTSEILFREISSFMPLGKRLKVFCGRLGDIFGLYQERSSQSEPEITHFNIRGGFSSIDHEYQEFMLEAEKWGILSRVSSTKGKSLDKKDDCDWMLNPIYAPYFFISYRKIRKTVFDSDEIKVLIDDSVENYEKLKSEKKNKLELLEDKLSIEKLQQGLFE